MAWHKWRWFARMIRSFWRRTLWRGDKVVSLQNEELGTMEHLMIDLTTHRIAYAVLSFGGLLGMDDKLFAVPWSASRWTRLKSDSS